MTTLTHSKCLRHWRTSCGHNLDLLRGFARIDRLLNNSAKAATEQKHKDAVQELDAALAWPGKFAQKETEHCAKRQPSGTRRGFRARRKRMAVASCTKSMT